MTTARCTQTKSSVYGHDLIRVQGNVNPEDREPHKRDEHRPHERQNRERVEEDAAKTADAGGDQPFFEDLLSQARRRSNAVRCVVADAVYDSEENHRIARLDMNVRSIIPPRAGRPTQKLPVDPFRLNMHRRFGRGADKAIYGQRWQSETVNSMIKRNLGSALRARTAVRRRHELLLRVLTHNIMLLAKD